MPPRTTAPSITSAWKRVGPDWLFRFGVPPNASATAFLPAAAAGSVREGGKSLAKAKGVRLLAPVADGLAIRLAPGQYEFTVSH